MNQGCYDGMDIIMEPSRIALVTRKWSNMRALDLTLWEVRKQLGRIGYSCPYSQGGRDEYFSDDLENYAIPFMNYVYYYEIYMLGRVPTLQEFFDAYIKLYCKDAGGGMLMFKDYFDPSRFSFTKEQLMGRVFRSYNSFHREVDLLYQLSKHKGFSPRYSFRDDRDGIDFTVRCRGKDIYIASYISSERSIGYKQVKNGVRHDYSGMLMVDMVANWGQKQEMPVNCVKRNGIWLYAEDYVSAKCMEIEAMAVA